MVSLKTILKRLLVEYLPALVTLLSVGLLLNPALSWQQVAALFFTYALYAGHAVLRLIRSDREVSDRERLENIEEEVRQIVQARSFKSLQR